MAKNEQHGPLELGSLFAQKYLILDLIGRGGYACVYSARHQFLGHRVAIKVLFRLGGVSEEAIRRALAEAQILHDLHHPNVVEVKDAGLTDSGLFYEVMELLQGRPLFNALREHGHLEVEEVLLIIAQVAGGMQAAHERGVIHRDLKPENLFVLPDEKTGNKVKVIDFGVAKLVDAVVAWSTQKQVVLGTLYYMSPEQVQPPMPMTPRSDIYTLGVIAYEALTGRQPVKLVLDSASPTTGDVLRAIVLRAPPFVDELDPDIPRDVADFVARMMAKRPEERFESMVEVGEAARQLQERHIARMREQRREPRMRELWRPMAPHSTHTALRPSEPEPTVFRPPGARRETSPSSRPSVLGADVLPAPSGSDRPAQEAPQAPGRIVPLNLKRRTAQPADRPTIRSFPEADLSPPNVPHEDAQVTTDLGGRRGLERLEPALATPAQGVVRSARPRFPETAAAQLAYLATASALAFALSGAGALLSYRSVARRTPRAVASDSSVAPAIPASALAVPGLHSQPVTVLAAAAEAAASAVPLTTSSAAIIEPATTPHAEPPRAVATAPQARAARRSAPPLSKSPRSEKARRSPLQISSGLDP